MKKSFAVASMVLITGLLLLAMTATGAMAANGPDNAPRIKVKNGSSTNWSGYAVATSLVSPQNNSVTDVKGSWTVPSVTGTSNAWSSTWVGIDGYSDGTVEQIGIDQDWSSGAPRYFAWYEMYPKFPVTISAVPVKPGDNISAEVSYSTNTGSFTLSISDLSTGTSYSVSKKAKAQRQSAEWIEEAPSSRKGVLPLASFGTVNFTGASATINGHTGSINDLAWQYDAITMTSLSGTVEALPSLLSPDGTGFSVAWKSS